jgi:hypothetical protein
MRKLCLILGIYLAAGNAILCAQDQPAPAPAEPVAEPAPPVPASAEPANVVVVEPRQPTKLRLLRDTPSVKVTWKNNGTKLVDLQRIDFEGVEVAIENVLTSHQYRLDIDLYAPAESSQATERYGSTTISRKGAGHFETTSLKSAIHRQHEAARCFAISSLKRRSS